MNRIKTSEIQSFETEHINTVRTFGAECALLLERDGTFPLAMAEKIALFGNGARKTIKGGTGSGDVNVRHFVTIEEGLKNAGFEITTTAWMDRYDELYDQAKRDFFMQIRDEAKAYGINPTMYGLGKNMPEPEYEIPLDSEGETALYILARNSGEGSDRKTIKGDIELTDSEIRDIHILNKKYKNFMLVLNTGGMVNLAPVKGVKNILLLGQLGSSTGDILADIILGKAYPSGKLAMTWADINEYPSTAGFGDINDTSYEEGVYVGYRYFDTVDQDVMYPFGYGLGFTDFEVNVKDISINKSQIRLNVLVTNIGQYYGKEVVQVYFSAPSKKLARPYQELAGFAKTKELAPGESCKLELYFEVDIMSAYDESTASYILESGRYIVAVGNSSRNTIVCGAVDLDNEIVVKKLKNICVGDKVSEKEIEHKKVRQKEDIVSEIPIIKLDEEAVRKQEVSYSEDLDVQYCTEDVTFTQVKNGIKTAEEYVASLTDEELALLCIGAYPDAGESENIIGSASFDVAGAAGETTNQLKGHADLENLVMADGPAGVRISTTYKIIDGKAKATSNPLGGDILYLIEPEELEKLRKQKTPEELAAQEYYQYCVAIPIGTDIAQSFNLDLAKTFGNIVAEEMELFGVHLWLAPALNIQRSPLCGRNFEYYSEDPLVGGLMAAAMTNGVQTHKGCGTTIKHFVCNNQETNRYASNSIVSERAVREIYLRGFEICVKNAQPHALMSSYNLINGEHVCNSKDLLTYVLRDEWGYKGIVMTDWYITTDLMANPGNKHPLGSAAGCVKAGNDISMPGAPSDLEDILKALKDERHPYHISRGELQVCALRVIKKILELRNSEGGI